ncbi:MAG: thiolase domain-containing protein [Burkholderiaceae bacterium]
MANARNACIAGIYEHPLRLAPDHSVGRLHADVAHGALKDAGLSLTDVDAYFCAGDAPGLGPTSIIDYLGLQRLECIQTTEIGGASYLSHVGEAAAAIAAGRCKVALVTLAGRPKSEGSSGTKPRNFGDTAPDVEFERHYLPTPLNSYAMCAMRHMHEFGTTAEQLAWIKVAMSHHAQHNPHALLRTPMTVEDVLQSPRVADPLRRADCCVVTDGGGAVVVVHPDIAKNLRQPLIEVVGMSATVKGQMGGQVDLTYSGAAWCGPRAFEQAGITPNDIRYASIYDSFTITVLMQLEDLGFCAKGQGGRFVADGQLIAGQGRLAVNTDGGGLCSNHPANRGGMTKVIEAVRQLRGQAHPRVQVPNLEFALANGIGGFLGSRHGAATLIMKRV